ncbi:hypothetical protein EV127DRAFT_447902 [Xylaria flabelliformis]|nr:hypothetical protein EV127DRAFT_447902 [Xylaria flabelliformis]
MGKDIIIYHNDLTDSDNWAAARFVQHAALKSSSIDVIWIVEPRQVSLGLSMTEEQINECRNLLETHFPSYKDPYQPLRGGFLQQSDLDNIEGLTEHDRHLLEFAIKPAYGPKEDARLHGRLVALDLLNFLGHGSGDPIDVFLDVDTLDSIENPVNLNVHHHEELVARNREELEGYQVIMNKPYPQRVQDLREWYHKCINSLETTADEGRAVRNLDFVSLCEKVKAAKSVKFFGGASLGLLQRLIHEGAASNIQCSLQAGAFDVSKLLFHNQFNIALNPDAAKFVFSKAHIFSRFVIVPSEATKRVKYALSGLIHESSSLGKRCLGFNCRVDPMKLAIGEVTMNDFLDKTYPMPDLTAFLCAFHNGFAGSTSGYVSLVDTGGSLILRRENSGIRVYEIDEDRLVGEQEISAILSTLVLDGQI